MSMSFIELEKSKLQFASQQFVFVFSFYCIFIYSSVYMRACAGQRRAKYGNRAAKEMIIVEQLLFSPFTSIYEQKLNKRFEISHWLKTIYGQSMMEWAGEGVKRLGRAVSAQKDKEEMKVQQKYLSFFQIRATPGKM